MNLHISFLKVALATGLAWFALIASASERSSLDVSSIRAQQLEIRADAEARKGRYKRLPEARRDELRQQQDLVDRLLLADVQRTDQLNEHDQIALFNALQSIQSIVNAAENDRLVCERYKPTGTKRPLTVCKTVAERKIDRENAENEIARRQQFCEKGPAETCLDFKR